VRKYVCTVSPLNVCIPPPALSASRITIINHHLQSFTMHWTIASLLVLFCFQRKEEIGNIKVNGGEGDSATQCSKYVYHTYICTTYIRIRVFCLALVIMEVGDKRLERSAVWLLNLLPCGLFLKTEAGYCI
jgi:hypothetical protein